jgi:cation transport ATPase
MNALAVLLVACPRAVGIAAPLVSAAAVGRAAAAGVLVRAGATFERLARCRRVFLDKTGTLTRGAPRVVSVLPAPGAGEEEVLSLAAGLEAHSEHPIARAVREGAAARGIAPVVVSELRAAPGRGVVGRVGHGRVSRLVRLGTAGFTGVSESSGMAGRSLVHLSADGRAVGGLELEDEPRPFAHEAVRDLQARGLAVELISGDCRGAVAALAAGLPGVVASAELFPEGKLERIEASRARGEVPARVSHAIGDARALSRAAVGVTLVSGTDMARELADVTVLGGDLRRLGWTLGLAQHTVRHARVNLFGAFSYNAVGLVLAAQGRLSPLLGAIATVAAGLLVVLHARRLARYPLPGKPPRSGKRHGLHPERV